jgi:hypothetical protein
MAAIGQNLRSSDTSMESVNLKQTKEYVHRDLQDNDIFRLEQVDSDDIPSSKEQPMDDRSDINSADVPFYQQLLRRMNPSECFSPTVATVATVSATAVQGCTTSAFKACLASDREEFDSILHDILKDIRIKNVGVASHKSAPRTLSLRRLYRLTDREHAHNRYVV